MFAPAIKRIVDHCEGAMGGVVMGIDGIDVAKHMAKNQLDLSTIGVEFAYIVGQAKRAAEALQLGAIDEFTIKAEQLTLIIRMLTSDYFLAVVLGPSGNTGKCRFLMRVAASEIAAQL